MAHVLVPSSFVCDCGYVSQFSERTVGEMEVLSRRARRPRQLRDAESVPHVVEFEGGRATTVICPALGRCAIAHGV
jgi:hypothetical protein